MNSPTKIRDASPVNARTFDIDTPFAERRYEYLIAKRDQVQDRIRTGALALNGSALVAMMAMLADEAKAAKWIGLTDGNARLSAAAFTIGVLSAGVAFWAVNALFTEEAAAAFTRYMKTRQLTASYDGPTTEPGWNAARDALEEYAKSPLVDFRYSPTSILAQNISAACWVIGMVIPLFHSFGLS